ncbi:hypothetical protein L829_1120 [Mycobacteroides abscessus MAB_030201_1075]|uniref:Uncharacterized protein n=1 Tax=Mycobacteroides abscessus MAB_030201_1075 TaxID=1335410 RepID=A0A829PMA7_9MYCO|nr:hypothetical protein [Mycobacteroides abscessus]ETZ70223.1 hypothetical protein L835_3137 [Mycobacteroides abscessus MAB_110811_1470]ETZ87572.1 hypothetical protein L829_1120 [Mycobacteroides abscessus MAB_030201_1075]ETZ92863.1 hypothetical protein L828_3207 [Mycobacteroides abscessus MAB_030201_1061]
MTTNTTYDRLVEAIGADAVDDLTTLISDRVDELTGAETDDALDALQDYVTELIASYR